MEQISGPTRVKLIAARVSIREQQAVKAYARATAMTISEITRAAIEQYIIKAKGGRSDE